MEINSEINNYYNQLLVNNDLEELKSKYSHNNKEKIEEKMEDEKLKLLANEFASILMGQMFKAMRNTVPESELINGGFAEDVFTDMLDNEISKLGVEQDGFSTLGRLLYQQLKGK